MGISLKHRTHEEFLRGRVVVLRMLIRQIEAQLAALKEKRKAA